MKLRKGMLGTLLGITFATTLLATNSVHAETSYTGSVETNQSTENKVGWQKIGDYWYYFDEPGKKHIGWLKLNNNWYYFDKYTGIMHTYVLYTEEHGDVNGKTYYFDPQSGIMQTGWVTDKGGDKHYYYSDGTMARNTKIGEYTIDNYGLAYIENYTGWQYKSDNWYYYVNGEAVTGWKFINNNWYYFDVYGQMATGLVSPVLMHGGGWYLLDSSGAMKTGWQKYNGEWCYFGSSGNMYMGWQKIDGKWYYFGPSKNMPELVTVNEKGEWYPYNISGAMKTGWQKINGVWYYFDASGAMKTGWLDESGKKYYLQSSGAMATNTTVDGYKIDASGVATKVIQTWDTNTGDDTSSENPFEESPSHHVTDTKFREEIETIPRKKRTVYDKTLAKGQTKVVQGHDGQKRLSYRDTYYQGALSYSTPLEEEILVEPQDDVTYIGCKVEASAFDIVDFKIGDTILGHEVLEFTEDLKPFVNRSYLDLMGESEDARYEKANKDIDASYIASNPSDPILNRTLMWLGLSDDGVFAFNTGQFIDIDKLNEMFVAYINVDRERKQLKPLSYDRALLPVATVRAQEMADYGHPCHEGKAHTRPDSSEWSTALSELPEGYRSVLFGENMLAHSILSNPYQLVSEQHLAKAMFEQWKSSPLHYAAMMSPTFTHTAVDCKLTTRATARSGNETNWLIGTEIFSVK